MHTKDKHNTQAATLPHVALLCRPLLHLVLVLAEELKLLRVLAVVLLAVGTPDPVGLRALAVVEEEHLGQDVAERDETGGREAVLAQRRRARLRATV